MNERVHCLPLLIFLGLVVFAADWSLAQSETFTLSGVVMSESGTPMIGVRVYLKGGEVDQMVITDKDGQFRFEVSAGKYDLIFQKSEHYETVIKDIELRRQPLNSLKIILPRLTFELDLEMIGPIMVAAPSLEVSLDVRPPFKVGRPMRGTVFLKNVGKEPILIPTEPFIKDSQYSTEAKLMWISIDDRSQATYWQPYICLPAKNCKELRPSETISFPFTMYRREGYQEQGKREVQVYQKRGDNKLSVHVSFGWLTEGRDTRTQPIEKEITVFVQPN